MKNTWKCSLVAGMVVAMLAGCQNDSLVQQPTPQMGAARVAVADIEARYNQLSPNVKAKAAALLVQFAQLDGELGKLNPDLLGAVTPSPCVRTDFDTWTTNQYRDWTPILFRLANNLGMNDLPLLDAFLYGDSPTYQSFGYNGEHTQRLTKTFKDLRRFWDIETGNMTMLAMHGSVLRDRARLVRAYTQIAGLSAAEANELADIVEFLLAEVPQYQNGNHPGFTLNAFAAQPTNFPPVGQIGPKIIMGDGILKVYDDLGFGDVAPQAILAHEFGHQIQYQRNVYGPGPDTPESSRRTELMADAFSAYYLSHARGASMQWKRVKQFLGVFYNLGDCLFTSDGHHGTPAQRMRAAEWGYSVADQAQKQGHILTSQEFIRRFDAQLATIVQ